MPDLNQENPLVSRYLIQNAMWWVETANLDGIRLDTFPYLGRAFWHDFHAALHAAYWPDDSRDRSTWRARRWLLQELRGCSRTVQSG
jgi:glycosidase